MMMLSVESQVCISLFNYIKLLTPHSLKVPFAPRLIYYDVLFLSNLDFTSSNMEKNMV